jgi:molybdopterin-guanine dinucleotide biosynthesis protein A
MSGAGDELEGRVSNVAGAVLVGGASSRMGSDKAHCELDGVPFATRIAELLSRFFVEVLLVGGDPPPGAPGQRVPDADGPQSSLRGLVSALQGATAERVLVVATDMPLVSAELLLALTAWPEHDAVVPRADGQAHPLCAIYRREPALAAARERLEAGELRLRGVLDRLDTVYFEAEDLLAVDPAALALVNVNTPQELSELGSKIVDDP